MWRCPCCLTVTSHSCSLPDGDRRQSLPRWPCLQAHRVAMPMAVAAASNSNVAQYSTSLRHRSDPEPLLLYRRVCSPCDTIVRACPCRSRRQGKDEHRPPTAEHVRSLGGERPREQAVRQCNGSPPAPRHPCSLSAPNRALAPVDRCLLHASPALRLPSMHSPPVRCTQWKNARRRPASRALQSTQPGEWEASMQGVRHRI